MIVRRDNHWLKERALAGIVVPAPPELVKIRIDNLLTVIMNSQIRPQAIAAIKKHRQRGDRLILATASFDFYVHELGRRLGFDDVICTDAQRNDRARLTGRIAGRNCYGEEKRRRTEEIFGPNRQAWTIVVYTDHHSDLPLLEWADVPIVVNPTHALLEVARQRCYETLDWPK